MRMGGRVKLFVSVFVLLTFSGCAMLEPAQPTQPVQPTQPPTERPKEPLPPSTKPTYNLMGYPPATQEGYVDGCETAKKSIWGFKDLKRYESDGQYRTGWDDGFFICNRKK